MDYRDIPIKPMTDEEARQWIAKCGGWTEYNKKMQETYHKPTPAPAPIAKSEQDIIFDYCDVIAKARGFSGALELLKRPFGLPQLH